MADIQSPNPLVTSAGQPGSTKGPQASGASGGVADQAKDALKSVSDRASDTFDDVSRQGARYYRQGTQAVGNVDSGTMTAMFIAGSIGFGLAWLIFGQRSYEGDYIADKMSRSSDRRY